MRVLVLVAISSWCFANLELAPPNINMGPHYTGVFVDIQKADYKLTYDVDQQRVSVVSKIEFLAPEEGMPIFDLVPQATHVNLNGQYVQMFPISNSETTYKLVNQVVPVGKNQLTVKHYLNSKHLEFFNESVESGFWMIDIRDREFLEQYLVSNLEYDQYQMNIEVQITGTDKEHLLMSNAAKEVIGLNHFRLQTPHHFNASSLFFHLFPSDRYEVRNYSYRSIDGRDFPISIYSESMSSDYIEQTIEVLDELERDYGPWPHAGLVGFMSTKSFGGMEYAGAHISVAQSVVAHEIHHSYYARGVMPADGKSGWVDEAVCGWRDEGYEQVALEDLEIVNIGNFSPYRRYTHMESTPLGYSIIGHLDLLTEDRGGMLNFLRHFFQKYKFQVITTEIFIKELNEYFNDDFTELIHQYVLNDNAKN